MELYDYLWEHNADSIKEKRGVRLSDISARRGSYSPERGEKQPCIRVYLDKTDRKTYFQFVPLFRICGPKSVMMREIIDGELNTEEELCFEWSDFSVDLKDIKKFVLYAYS